MEPTAWPRRAPLWAAAWMIVMGQPTGAAEPVWPGKTWARRPPKLAGLDEKKLKAFSKLAGGRGCVVRGGCIVHTWGDAAKRGDVASAAKVFYSHFLFKAVETRLVAALDAKAVDFEPRLAEINPKLGHKDRQITFRHLANQISCYGLAEKPAAAYAYNDWQMALFWDVLFLKAYKATYRSVDAKVFAPLLTGPIGCEDKPTMMAFGPGNRPGRVAISPRDFARFGLLYLRSGRWRGRQLIRPKHVKLATTSPLPNSIPRAGRKAAEMIPGQRSIGSTRIPDNQTDHMGSYSWLWWTNGVDREGKRHWPDAPTDTYGAFGHGGIRAMVVLPSVDLIVSWNDAKTRGREKENAALKLLLAAVADRRPTGPRGAVGPVEPKARWTVADPAEVGMDAKLLAKARDHALTGGGSGCIVRGGRLVMRWGDPKRRYDLKSTTKSIGVTALGLAIGDGKIKLTDKASKHHRSIGSPPASNVKTGWLDEITIFHLATQTAGFDKPGGYQKLLFRPGTKWSYSDGGPNWLAECVTLVYRRDLTELMFERVFGPLGIGKADLTWRRNSYRPAKIDGLGRREFGSGISANVGAMARIGLLYLREGRWGGRQILPGDFVAACRTTPKALRGLPVVKPDTYPGASGHYGLLWWNNNDGTLRNVPRDTYWSWGLYDSLIVVLPSLDVVAARAGKSWKGNWGAGYGKLTPFLGPIVASVKGTAAAPREAASAPPYPPSPVIRSLTWAPKGTIVRKAAGSDNWPITWADDGHQYTAYGDGWGFEPKVRDKLSLGICRVEGPAAKFRGVNVRSRTGEQRGGGSAGKKAGGMVCIDGVLYMFVRNAGISQLAWSADHGKTWRWSGWRFKEGFGCPTVLNFGRDYAGARDGYVYVYSFDSPTAYKPSDRMVLARVPKARIRDREAYEFFVKRDAAGGAVWSKDIRRRGAVFAHEGQCYRSGISYNAPLKRYLWVQVVGGRDTRFSGGLAVFDAPEPWGPWTTVYFTRNWDVGPGESAGFPTKWIGSDGTTLHLVFSGDDCFSVRRATLAVDRRN